MSADAAVNAGRFSPPDRSSIEPSVVLPLVGTADVTLVLGCLPIAFLVGNIARTSRVASNAVGVQRLWVARAASAERQWLAPIRKAHVFG